MRRSIGSRSICQRSTQVRLSLGARFLTYALAKAQLRGVSREEQLERPVEGDAQLSIEARQAQQVVRAPKKPSDEAGDHDVAGQLRDGLASAQRRHHAKCAIAKWLRGLSSQRGDDIVRQRRP